MMGNAKAESHGYALTTVATTGPQESSFSHNSSLEPENSSNVRASSTQNLHDSKSKNRVVHFAKLTEFKINRDVTRPSLFSRGGDTQVQAIFDHQSNPHPFECAQGRRW